MRNASVVGRSTSSILHDLVLGHGLGRLHAMSEFGIGNFMYPSGKAVLTILSREYSGGIYTDSEPIAGVHEQVHVEDQTDGANARIGCVGPGDNFGLLS
jgi:hypothetical protein